MVLVVYWSWRIPLSKCFPSSSWCCFCHLHLHLHPHLHLHHLHLDTYNEVEVDVHSHDHVQDLNQLQEDMGTDKVHVDAQHVDEGVHAQHVDEWPDDL
jgi:hypothetical protein